MDIIIYIFFFIVIITAVLIVIRQMVSQKNKTDEMIKRVEVFNKRQQHATPGKGLIIHSDGGVMPARPSAKAPVALTMEITPGTGKPYRAKTQWLVDVTALSYVAQGQDVAVKIDVDDKNIIYPNSSWAKYIVP